ncbi:uncharacterized protein RHO25_003435 [Cercospora beticola]|uniref:AAA+ ATPase domain-containing protein n=1 Tax=Cercospora beticola TaxID=122368 RepID=A0ABZ0NH07_CERBT|nr:hypothetical protein RHO25_003435 [Cercospora beticola]
MPARRSKEQKAAELTAGGGSALTVTAQQSRFHTEMDEDNNRKEIVVKDLSMSLGNRELLSHADLQLQRGRHYILHGRNGIGKSTLLKAIADDQIPNIPRSVKALLLGQTQSNVEDELEKLDLSNTSVLEYVVRSDQQRETYMHEAKVLSAALESTVDPNAAVKAYRQIQHERLERRVHVIRQLALRRSGPKGRRTRDEQIKLEEELEISEARLNDEVTVDELSEKSHKAAETLTDVQTALELMDADGAEAKARSVLLGLGFSAESIDQPRSNLSGGWQTRCSLACALCQSVDLLLLDEPTNFLDLPSIIWLERYLAEIADDTTVMVVTHDRAFGDEVAEELLVLRHRQLERFKGNLSNYEMQRLKTYKYMTRMKEAQDKQKKHIEGTIQNNIQAAKRAGDDKKLKQAASRKKKLDERMGLEVSAKGTRFKINRDLGGYYLTNRAGIEIPTFDPPAELKIPAQPADLRHPGSLVSLEKVNFSYTVAKKKVPILTDIDLTIHLGDRIGIAGLNGSGKSTLVSLIMGHTSAEPSKPMLPSSGTITKHTRAQFGLYSQQAAEELEAISAANPQATALSHLMEHIGASFSEQEARGILSGVGLSGKVASDVPISLLSGGQRVRLALAKLLHHPPHLLILDEVTTHLDTDTIQALIGALKTYEGAILVVTHDRFFMKTVVENCSIRSLAGPTRPEDEEDEESEDSEEDEEDQVKRTRVVFRLSKGKLSKLQRGMEQYEEIAARSATKLAKEAASVDYYILHISHT